MWPAERLRRARGPVLHIAIGACSVEMGWFEGDAFDATSRVGINFRGANASAMTQTLSAAIQALGGATNSGGPRPCRILVSDAWLRAAELAWSDRFLGTASEVAKHVRALFAASGWSADEGGKLRWIEAAALRPRVVVMYPSWFIQAINAALEACSLTLESMKPASVVAYELVRPLRPAAVAVIEVGASTFFPVARASAGQPVVEWTDEPIDAATLAWRRWLLYAPREERDFVMVDLGSLYSSVDAGPVKVVSIEPRHARNGSLVGTMLTSMVGKGARRNSALDAVKRRPRRTLVHAMTGLAVAGALMMALQLKQSFEQLNAMRAELVRAEPVDVPKAPPLTKAELARSTRIDEVVRELNAPVSAVVASLKAPADIDVQVLSADVDANMVGVGRGGRRITLQAESRQPLDMQRYVDYLSARPHFAGAALTRHDLSEGGAGLYRFTVEASWLP